jgi:hypothetical protein
MWGEVWNFVGIKASKPYDQVSCRVTQVPGLRGWDWLPKSPNSVVNPQAHTY